ncbi:hypothetical protein C8J57DRAFT_1533848 [Mycena rebaudengoi]|nr:hypothetical protein C8J57DRAFT_1533848 [Mycena rebaudengoi]
MTQLPHQPQATTIGASRPLGLPPSFVPCNPIYWYTRPEHYDVGMISETSDQKIYVVGVGRGYRSLCGCPSCGEWNLGRHLGSVEGRGVLAAPPGFVSDAETSHGLPRGHPRPTSSAWTRRPGTPLPPCCPPLHPRSWRRLRLRFVPNPPAPVTPTLASIMTLPSPTSLVSWSSSSSDEEDTPETRHWVRAPGTESGWIPNPAGEPASPSPRARTTMLTRIVLSPQMHLAFMPPVGKAPASPSPASKTESLWTPNPGTPPASLTPPPGAGGSSALTLMPSPLRPAQKRGPLETPPPRQYTIIGIKRLFATRAAAEAYGRLHGKNLADIVWSNDPQELEDLADA